MKNTAANLIRGADISIGTWLTIGSPVIMELASYFPFNWLLLDTEHGNITDALLLENLRALKNSDIAVMVRVPSIDASIISRMLDWGADGIMVPHVTSKEQAIRCVEGMYYPPMGNRGYSGSVRRYQYGLQLPKNTAEIRPLLFVQIEDVEGINNAESIAAVEGVDVLFVGPSDLKISLNGQKNQKSTFEEALKKIANAAKKYNKNAGILIRDYSQLLMMKDLGYSCIAMDSDLAIIRKGFQQIITMVQR